MYEGPASLAGKTCKLKNLLTNYDILKVRKLKKPPRER